MTNRVLVLHLLREAGERGVTTGEFLEAGCGSRFGARIFELCERGHVIESERVRNGSYRYTLTRDAAEAAGATGQNDCGPSLGGHPPSAGGSPGIPHAGHRDGHQEPEASGGRPEVPEQTRLELAPCQDGRLSFMDYDEEAA